MNRRTGTAARACAVLLAALLTATGCATAVAGAPGSTVVVGGARTGSATGWVPELEQELETAISTGATWTFVSADGGPEVLATLPLASDAENDLAAATELDAVREQARGLLDSPARSPEADPLGALVLAGRTLSGLPQPHRILLTGSLLQTVAPLPFQDRDGALLGADPDQVLDRLDRDGALPALEGVEVVVIGGGDVVPPQARLPEATRQALLEFWTTLLHRAGATVHVVESPRTGSPPPGLPPVTPVPVAEPPPVAVDVPTVATLPDQVLGFLPDRAEFRDPAAAERALAPYTEALGTGRFQVEVTGTTSSAGTPEGRLALSRDRAALVAILLLRGSGADPGLVTVRALGSDFPGSRPDRDAAGELDPVAAAANRQVIIRLVPR